MNSVTVEGLVNELKKMKLEEKLKKLDVLIKIVKDFFKLQEEYPCGELFNKNCSESCWDYERCIIIAKIKEELKKL